MFWPDAGRGRAQVEKALEHVTIAVGNREECEVAVGETDPQPRGRRPARPGARAGDRQAGPQGGARRHPRRAGRGADLSRSRWSTVWAPATRSAARWCHGLLGGWDLRRDPRVRQRRRGHRRLPAGVLDGHARRGRGRRARWPTRSRRHGRGGADDRRRTRHRHRSRSPTSPRSAPASPAASRPAWAARAPPRRWSATDGRLLIVAADHPARGALGVRADGDGHGQPQRPARAARRPRVARPGVDGVLGTPDILDDLLLMGALEDKVVIGSMNRGGLQGAALRAGRPLHGLPRRRHRGPRPRRRQDAHPHRPRRPRHRRHAGGQRRTPSRELADLRAHGDGRAVPLGAARRPGRQPARPGLDHQVDPHRLGARRVQRLHLAEAAGRRRPRPGHGRHHAADAAARRRPAGRPAGHLRRPGAARSTCRPCAASSSVAPCSTRPDGDVAAAVDIAAELVHGTAR